MLLDKIISSLSDPHAIIILPMKGMILTTEFFIVGRTFYLIEYEK